MKPFVSVIIPAFNEERYIGQCLQSLEAQTYPRDRFEVIVVDNNSKDNTAAIVSQYDVILLSKKEGPVGAVRNFGVANCRGEIIAFIDADCVAPPDWLEIGVMLIKEHPEKVVGGGYRLKENPNWIERSWLLGDQDKNVPKDLLGGCTIIYKDTFNSISGFSDAVTSGEDTLLTIELRNKGFTVTLTPEFSVIHLGNPATMGEFFKRQIWHSENYARNFFSSLKDPTFILVLVYTLMFFLVLISILIKPLFSIYPIFILTMLPAILSAKRIIRSGTNTIKISQILPIYFLDTLYLLARSFSFLKSIGTSTKIS